MALQMNRPTYDQSMGQDGEKVKRYTRAQSAFDSLVGGVGMPSPLGNAPIEPFTSLPFNDDQKVIIIEAVEARTAYCADLVDNGFPPPVGFCDQTKSIGDLLR